MYSKYITNAEVTYISKYENFCLESIDLILINCFADNYFDQYIFDNDYFYTKYNISSYDLIIVSFTLNYNFINDIFLDKIKQIFKKYNIENRNQLLIHNNKEKQIIEFNKAYIIKCHEYLDNIYCIEQNFFDTLFIFACAEKTIYYNV